MTAKPTCMTQEGLCHCPPLEVSDKMSHLSWSELPTECGYFFMRYRGRYIGKASIVHVHILPDGSPWEHRYGRVVKKVKNVEWAGPITSPP